MSATAPLGGSAGLLRAAAARAGQLACALSLSAAVTLGGPGPLLRPPSAIGITNEQLLFIEAWRAVDRAYYDKTFNGTNWFKASSVNI